MPYDSKCYDLAEHFLDDEDHSHLPEIAIERLAIAIQGAVDDFIEDLHTEHEAARDKAAEDKMDERRLNHGKED